MDLSSLALCGQVVFATALWAVAWTAWYRAVQ